MLEQQNKPFFHSSMYRCKGPTAFLGGLYLDCFISPLQSHGKLIMPPSSSICRTREIKNHLLCEITMSTWADTNPTPAAEHTSLRCLPSAQRLTKNLGVPGGCVTLWSWFAQEGLILCHIDSFGNRWGTCWVSSLMMFLFKSAGSLWHSQLQLVCILSLQWKFSLQAVHLRSALGQAKFSLSKLQKYLAFAVLIEKDLKKMPKLSSDILSNDSVASPSHSSSLTF